MDTLVINPVAGRTYISYGNDFIYLPYMVTEFLVAVILMGQGGRPVTNDMLYDYLYPDHDDPPYDTIFNNMASRARQALQKIGCRGIFINRLHGQGFYRLTVRDTNIKMTFCMGASHDKSAGKNCVNGHTRTGFGKGYRIRCGFQQDDPAAEERLLQALRALGNRPVGNPRTA